MKFIPYGKQNITIEDRHAVDESLQQDWITSGPKVKEFEEAVACYSKVKYGVAVTSGTAALDIAVQALQLPEGSEIITTPLTFIATINAILFNKHKPILADVDPHTYNIDPRSVRERITSKTKAIIYVDYAGQPCEIAELKKIAGEYDLFLIEDAAQALGAEYQGQPIGGFADMTTLSFHPVKHITTGEGGMVLTNNENFYHQLCLLRNHGIDKEVHERFGPDAGWFYDVKALARNYRITDFQCALGLSQLQKMEAIIKKREEIATHYTQELINHPQIKVPFTQKNVRHAWHLYPILIQNYDRNVFFKKMREKNIGVNVHHIPPYEFTYHQQFGWKGSDVPVADGVFRSTMTLPIYPELSIEEQNYIIQCIKEILQ